MRYSYEFKMMCVELYHSGSYPDIPEGLNPNTLKRHIRERSRLVDLHGPEVLKHKVFNTVWTPEEKLELISKVIAGLLYQWVHKYKLQGYNGLVESKNGRPTKEPRMKTSFEEFSQAVEEYIDYYNNKRIQAKTKWMPPVQYRIASMCSA